MRQSGQEETGDAVRTLFRQNVRVLPGTEDAPVGVCLTSSLLVIFAKLGAEGVG